jgi:hypothetical protein
MVTPWAEPAGGYDAVNTTLAVPVIGAALMAWGNAVKRKTAIIVAVTAGLVVALTASLFLVRAAENRVTQDLPP